MIVIIDYEVGNLTSIKKMLKKVGAGDAIISGRIDDIENATKLILPGVGHFDYGMKQLKSSGLIDVLNKRVVADKVPILGICLGAQLLTKGSEEGEEKGLALFKDMPKDSRFYFVHTYHMVCHEETDVAVTTSYGYEFAAGIAKDNIMGMQFHPEKSHKYGMQFLRNFVENY